jgi:hypothetical protein
MWVKGDMESLWKNPKESLLEVADEVCGKTKGPPGHRESWWWNEEVRKAVEEKRNYYKIWKESKKEEDRLFS